MTRQPPEMAVDHERRRLLKLASAIGAGTLLPGIAAATECSAIAQKESSDLLIDVHCHVFNADDLPVRGFANHIFFHSSGRGELDPRNWVSRTLDWLVQLSAPGIRTETKLLERILTGKEKPFDSYCRVEHPHGGILAQATNYRLHNALALTALYPETDLFVPAMVDMDLHLGDASLVTLRQQVDLMEYIFVATGGRFHGYVAFDPLRQARVDGARPGGHNSPMSPIRIVQRAVTEQGFIGVKLYPPMGFRPTGNSALQHCGGHGKQERAQYDKLLEELFEWCASERVPVLTHCNDSIYADITDPKDSDCFELGTPAQWAALFEGANAAKYEGKLRIDLGHFGRTDIHSRNRLALLDAEAAGRSDVEKLRKQRDEDLAESKALVAALAAHPESLFADLSNYDSLDDHRLRKAFKKDIGELIQANPHLSRQLMYGTDWFMTPQGGDVYLANMKEALPPPAHRDFYGGNAARFLGLAKGQDTRRRLEAFYRKWGIEAPSWARKIDQPPTA